MAFPFHHDRALRAHDGTVDERMPPVGMSLGGCNSNERAKPMMPLTARFDRLPTPAWIVLAVLGFVVWWPLGLAILAYILWSRKMGCCGSGFGHWHGRADDTRQSQDWWPLPRSSGNQAFDEYRAETLRRLEAEQREFQEFLSRLRMAKDKAEFDQFMAERHAQPEPSAAKPQA
jgi:uncharacterized protein DUF2852